MRPCSASRCQSAALGWTAPGLADIFQPHAAACMSVGDRPRATCCATATVRFGAPNHLARRDRQARPIAAGRRRTMPRGRIPESRRSTGSAAEPRPGWAESACCSAIDCRSDRSEPCWAGRPAHPAQCLLQSDQPLHDLRSSNRHSWVYGIDRPKPALSLLKEISDGVSSKIS